MNFELSEKHQLLQRAVREFAENAIAPRVAEMEQTQEFPADLIPEMGKVGLLEYLLRFASVRHAGRLLPVERRTGGRRRDGGDHPQ